MKLNAYDILPIQAGDYVFGYRESLDNPAVLFSGVGSGESQANEYEAVVVIPRATILALNTTPYALLTPPSGYGIQITSPIALVVNNAGLDFNFSSGETIEIYNNSLGSSSIAQFGDSSVTSQPISSAPVVFGYDVALNSPIYASATYPITGGGSAATMTFILKYRILSVQ